MQVCSSSSFIEFPLLPCRSFKTLSSDLNGWLNLTITKVSVHKAFNFGAPGIFFLRTHSLGKNVFPKIWLKHFCIFL